MYRAVHADRGGRILVADHPALAYDGARPVPFGLAIPLPPEATVISIEREALASERSGRPRRLGAGRLCAAALLPPGYLRTQLPAYVDEPGKPDLAPRQYAAVAADEAGALWAAGMAVEADEGARLTKADLTAKVAEGLRTHPGNRLVRQLARCAREYGCRCAANAFTGRGECALPVAAPSNARPPAAVAPHRDGEAEPTESAAFHPTTDELADLAQEHFAAGGTMVGFGRACEGEPLLLAREVEDAIARIRLGTRDGTIHLRTNGSMPGSLRRLRSAGLDSITVRLVSARAATYEALHGADYRFSEVRASLRLAAELRLSLSVLVLVLPGMFDRPDELAELIALLSELPAGSALLVRDLHADPLRALARLHTHGVEPIGVAAALARIKEQVGHVRVGSFARPLARVGVPNVP